MSGIYIHIPFCKQACSYCDFHFSTSVKNRAAMVGALVREIEMRRTGNEETIETIYFGGGTPSILETAEIEMLIEAVYGNFDVGHSPEITLEANPDDLSDDKILALSDTKINRLSIGIQSFFEEDLRLMNRAHDAGDALRSLETAIKHFSNISADLIYGTPGLTDEKWQYNVDTLLRFGIPHISSYALTVEPKTALEKMIGSGKLPAPSDEQASRQFTQLVGSLTANDFVHYELSNFGKPGFFSRNNSAYWLGKKYIGIGPSAHSYDGISRSWNVPNNLLYLKSMTSGNRPYQSETLSPTDRFNESVMTGLRTIWGVDLEKIETCFGMARRNELLSGAKKFLENGLLEIDGEKLKATPKGKFLADGIASDLFVVG